MQIVFSARDETHRSSGLPDLISYDVTLVNNGDGWDGINTFEAPVSGIYYFTVNFVKEAFGTPTDDDVFIHLRRGAETIGFAWSGQGAGFRGTGVFSVAIPLESGEQVQTYAASDGGAERLLRRLHFTGFLVSRLEGSR